MALVVIVDSIKVFSGTKASNLLRAFWKLKAKNLIKNKLTNLFSLFINQLSSVDILLKYPQNIIFTMFRRNRLKALIKFTSTKLFTIKVTICWRNNTKSSKFIAIKSSWPEALRICWSCFRSHLRFACWSSLQSTKAKLIPFGGACNNVDTLWIRCTQLILTCKWWERLGWCLAKACCNILYSGKLRSNRHAPVSD